MKAILVQKEIEGHPMIWADAPDPQIEAGQVLVKVHATSLNRADLMQRAGKYPPPPGVPDILGLDVAGEIVALGEGVPGWQIGDRVCGLVPGAGYAEYAAVWADLLIPIPDDWSYAEGAGFPEAYLTAYVNLFMEAGLQAGDTILIHGGASGVGTAGILMAHHAGCHVVTTAGTDEKVEFCRKLGANHAINYKQEDFAEAARAHLAAQSDKKGFDVILDMVGAAYYERNVKLLNIKGRIVYISTLSGSKVEIDIRQLMGKRARLIGSVLRPRTVVEKAEITANFRAQFGDLMTAAEPLKAIIDSIYPIEQANEAHEHMRQNKNIGKIILQVIAK